MHIERNAVIQTHNKLCTMHHLHNNYNKNILNQFEIRVKKQKYLV